MLENFFYLSFIIFISSLFQLKAISTEKLPKNLQIKQCSNENKEMIVADYRSAIKMLAKIQKGRQAYEEKKLSYKNKVILKKIKRKLECIDKRFYRLTIKCRTNLEKNCLDDDRAYTIRPRGNIRSFINTTNLCPSYFTVSNERYRSALLIHEVSHICATSDYKYFSNPDGLQGTPIKHRPNDSSKKPKNITHANAENYEYWALKGFCLPEDCSLDR